MRTLTSQASQSRSSNMDACSDPVPCSFGVSRAEAGLAEARARSKPELYRSAREPDSETVAARPPRMSRQPASLAIIENSGM